MDNPVKLAIWPTQDEENQNKNTTQYVQTKTFQTLQRTSQRGAPEGLTCSTSYKTLVVLLIYTVQSGKSIGTHRGKKHLRKKYKIYCHLRYGYFITVNRIVITTL
jgi:hypothetical protein